MRDGAALESARMALGLSISGLWRDCIALTGRLSIDRLGDYLAGRIEEVADNEHDIIVQALNELSTELGQAPPLAYSHP